MSRPELFLVLETLDIETMRQIVCEVGGVLEDYANDRDRAELARDINDLYTDEALASLTAEDFAEGFSL